MQLSVLPISEVKHRLKHSGLIFEIGFSTVCVKTSVPGVAEELSKLYAFYELADKDQFIDFYITLDAPLTRRWFRPQVNFSFDEHYPFKPLPQSQAFAMFEWGFNWVIANHAHQFLIIHAAVVEKQGFIIILPGMPGSGKSTLCAALVSRGWRLFSDEMTLINTKTGKVHPIPRPISLKNESINIIKEFAPNFVFGNEVFDTAKGTVAHARPPKASIQYRHQTGYPSAVIFPKYTKGSETKLNPISKGKTYMALAENSFNYSVLGVIGFDVLSRTIDETVCFEFIYEHLEEAMDLFDSMVK